MTQTQEGGHASPATTSGASQDMLAARRVHVRMMLIQQFHLESAFIGVPKLAVILGLSPSTVWGYMRDGKFFIRYRLFNKSPVVCIDDLVDWYCAADELILGGAVAPTDRPTAATSRSQSQSEQNAGVDDAVARALASIGIDPKSKRGSLRRA